MGLFSRKVRTGPAPQQPGRPIAAPSFDAGSPYSDASNRWAPKLGVTQPTHLQVAEDARGGRPGHNPSDPDRMNAGGNPLSEYTNRHNLEELNVNLDEGWQVQQERRRYEPSPYATPAVTTRPTTQMSPSNWRFLVPGWQDNGVARQLNGTHFSMATNQRTYPIGGMAPISSHRNTYRLEPVPRDVDIVDLPPDSSSHVNAAYTSPMVGATSSRNWRLM